MSNTTTRPAPSLIQADQRAQQIARAAEGAFLTMPALTEAQFLATCNGQMLTVIRSDVAGAASFHALTGATLEDRIQDAIDRLHVNPAIVRVGLT